MLAHPMIDKRALLLTGLILLAAAGAYSIWIIRPRASMNSRSLTAAPHSADQSSNPASKPITRSLHVDGCNEDFIVKPGELVEPRVVPGSPLDKFESLYGKPAPTPKNHAHQDSNPRPNINTWDQGAFSIAEGQSEEGDFVHVSLHQGHVVETLDGIELGIDSFGTIFRKMRDRKIEVHERLLNAEGKWTLILSLYSSCSHRFRSQYTRTFESTPEIEFFLHRRAPGIPANTQTPLRSDIFMNKVVSEYTIIPSNGHDDSPLGVPADHD
jgi:hypothetical protein